MATVTLGFFGWMAFILLQLLLAANNTTYAPAAALEHKPASNGIASCRDNAEGSRAAAVRPVGVSLLGARALGMALLALAFGLLARMHAPLTYYAYAVLPCVFWAEVLHHKVRSTRRSAALHVGT